jgi:hypothetical protein
MAFYDDTNFQKYAGLAAGAILFGGVALLAAPVAVPAIAAVGAGIGLTASVTAITAGVVVLSAVAGATVGYFTGDQAVPAVRRWLNEILSSDKGEGENVDELQKGGRKSEVGGPSRAEERTNAIYDDLTSATDDEFLNFLDKYREKAVLNISGQEGSLQDKKDKINAIFESTNYSYETSDQYATLQLPQDFATRKAEIIKAIIANPDFPSLSDETRVATKNRQASFTTDELIKRSLIFKTVVNKILDGTDDNKIETALKFLALQHGSSGSSRFAGTLQVQKQEVDNIFTGIASIVAAVSEDNTIIKAVVKNTVAGATAAGGAVTGDASTNTPVAIAAAAAAADTSVAHFAKTAATAGVTAATQLGTVTTATDTATAAASGAALSAAAAPRAADHPAPVSQYAVAVAVVAGVVAAANVAGVDALNTDPVIRAAVTKQIKQKTFETCFNEECDRLVQGFLSAHFNEGGVPKKLIFLFGGPVEVAYKTEKDAAAAAVAVAADDAGGRDGGGRDGGTGGAPGREGGAIELGNGPSSVLEAPRMGGFRSRS